MGLRLSTENLCANTDALAVANRASGAGVLGGRGERGAGLGQGALSLSSVAVY